MTSVIITTFEEDRKYLSKAIESCLNNVSPFEIIVVDAGSTSPLSMSGLESVYDLCDMFIRTQENLKQFGALNLGVGMAKGEHILILDADDTLEPFAIDKMAMCIGDNDVVYGNIRMRNTGADEGLFVTADKITKEELMLHNPIGLSSMFRRDLWVKVGGFQNLIYVDYRFWIESFMAGASFIKIDETIYTHTNRPGSITKKHSHQVEELNNQARIPLLK